MEWTSTKPDRQPLASAVLPPQRLMVFRLGRQAYAVPLTAVQEVLSMPGLSVPPGLPPMLAGFFRLDSEAVAVLHLAHLLQGEQQPIHLYTPLIVLQSPGPSLALIVDEIVNIIPFEQCDFVPVMDKSSINECTQGILRRGSEHVIVLFPDRLLLKAEQQRLTELTALEQTRLAELEEAAT